uniref:Uncharacterized protein n=1 Tax=Oryza nivara TaxID=4536 RepID=A0A0E0FGW2_ORYNI
MCGDWMVGFFSVEEREEEEEEEGDSFTWLPERAGVNVRLDSGDLSLSSRLAQIRSERRGRERERNRRREGGGGGGGRKVGEGEAVEKSRTRTQSPKRLITAAMPSSTMAVDTTASEYWLNWRFMLCAVWVYSCMVLACFLIWKYEGPSSQDGNGDGGEDSEDARPPRAASGVVYLEDCWKPCLEQIHPGWLLAFRVVSFFILASLLAVDVVVDGWSVFLYYTQWTFLLVTLYFGLGSVLSIYGCYQYSYKNGDNRSGADHGTYIIAPAGESVYDQSIKNPCYSKMHGGKEIAGFWGYLFQIMFQLLIGTHSINVVFMIGDTAMNSLRFPWFRIAYFLLWTGAFVNVQWLIHASISIWWPYPFLDLAFPKAPVFGGSSDAFPLLCFIRPGYEAKTISAGKMVSSQLHLRVANKNIYSVTISLLLHPANANYMELLLTVNS